MDDLHLPDGLDAFPEGAVHDDPGQEEAAREVPSDQVDVREACRDPEHPFTEMEVTITIHKLHAVFLKLL